MKPTTDDSTHRGCCRYCWRPDRRGDDGLPWMRTDSPSPQWRRRELVADWVSVPTWLAMVEASRWPSRYWARMTWPWPKLVTGNVRTLRVALPGLSCGRNLSSQVRQFGQVAVSLSCGWSIQ